MKRKLWLLNLVLIASVAGGAWRVRQEALAYKARERATLANKPPIPAAPPAPKAPPSPSVTASSYLDIAQRMLWAKDRNSIVIPDPPKPPEPLKPLPPLPHVHGVMNLGDGPIVMMSDQSSTRHRGIHPGDTIGAFKLISVDSEEVTLAFENRMVKKKLQELIDRGQDTAPAGGAPSPGGASTGAGGGASVAAAPAQPAKPEPGAKLTEGLSQCQAGDSSPPGTIANGMRKVVSQTPFGPACRWEAVK